MTFLKRIGLFLAVNALIVLTVSTLLQLLGVQPYLTSKGLDPAALAIFCLVWGMGGAFISLGLSRMIAKWSMGVQVIAPEDRDPRHRWLYATVRELAMQAKLPTTPEVGIYQSPDMNAFATGPTKSRSLVAVSTGLLDRMTEQQARAVLAHEVAHVANGDMVTMTLLQGIVNAFVMALARIVGFAVSQAVSGNRDENAPAGGGWVYFVTVIVAEIFFMLLGSLVVAAFSRYREYRADAGGASLAGRRAMIEALDALRANQAMGVQPAAQGSVAAMQIDAGRSWLALFSSHPPLEKRIERLSA